MEDSLQGSLLSRMKGIEHCPQHSLLGIQGLMGCNCILFAGSLRVLLGEKLLD